MNDFSFGTFWHGLKGTYKSTILGTILCGFLAHGMVMTNHLYYHDDIGGLFDLGLAPIALGRWLFSLLGIIDQQLTMMPRVLLPLPFVVFSLVGLALLACLFVRILGISSRKTAFLVGSALSTYPSITCLFGYLVSTPPYIVSLLLASAGAWLCVPLKSKRTTCAGILLIVLSLSIYQAYLQVILIILMIVPIRQLIVDPEARPATIIRRLGYHALIVLCACLLYMLTMRASLLLTGMTMTSYKGADQFSLDIITFLRRIPVAYQKFFLSDAKFTGVRRHYTMAILLLVLYAVWATVNVFRRNRANGLLLAVLFGLMPLATGILYILFPTDFVYPIMLMGNSALLALLFWLIEVLPPPAGMPVLRFSKAVSSGFAVMLICVFVKFDNICYMKATLLQHQAIAYFTTLITRIQSLPTYSDDKEVVFINAHAIEDKAHMYPTDLDFIQLEPYKGIDCYLNDYVFTFFMRVWCGYSPQMAKSEDFAELLEVQSMPAYPAANSIMEINNTIVVKLGKAPAKADGWNVARTDDD